MLTSTPLDVIVTAARDLLRTSNTQSSTVIPALQQQQQQQQQPKEEELPWNYKTVSLQFSVDARNCFSQVFLTCDMDVSVFHSRLCATSTRKECVGWDLSVCSLIAEPN